MFRRCERQSRLLGGDDLAALVRAALRARTMRTNGRTARGAGANLGENRLLERSDTLAFTTLGHPVLRTCHFSYSLLLFLQDLRALRFSHPLNSSTSQLLNPSSALQRSSCGISTFCSIPGHASAQTGYVGRASIILSLTSSVKSTSGDFSSI